MKRSALKAWGCEIRSFSQSAFEEFVDQPVARDFYERVLHITHQKAIAPEALRVQVSLRPDLFNSIQFLITGPHQEVRQTRSGYIAGARSISYICLLHTNRQAAVTFDTWLEMGRPWGGSVHWQHMLEEEQEAQVGEA